MKMRILAFIAVFFLLGLRLFAQNFSFSFLEDISLEKNGSFLKNPFSGSWNSGQFWPCDMNFDGQNDLLVFDKAGNRTLVFLKETENGNPQWKYSREFEDLLPPVQSWLATADFNCDGRIDIFTRSPLGIKVYRNSSETPGQAAFVLESEGLMTEGFNGQVNIQVNAYGAPAITDVDGDGDLDVLNFDFSGNTVEYHKNRVRELSGNCAGFSLKKDSCVFGRFSTKPVCGQIRLNTSCTGNLPGETDHPDKNIQHLGSQLSAIDLDNDGDKDLLVGDLACPLLNRLTNGGNRQQALITSADTLFPSAEDYVRIRDFPAAYQLDADFDGDTDLVVSPTYFSNYSDGYVHNTRQASFLYSNNSAGGAPQFQFQMKDFLQSECLDAGEEAMPVFADADADGDQDLFLGHLGNQGAAGLRASIHFYRNTGTANFPAFRLETEDYMGLSELGLVRMRPVFSDFNLDGRTDLGWMAARGVSPGDSTIFQYLLNQSEAGQPFSFPPLQNRMRLALNFGIYDAPHFTDVDGDLLPDLLLAKYNGKIQYWRRQSGWPGMNFQLENANYGNIARAPFANGPSLMTGDVNQDGLDDLMIGDNSGAVKIYSAFRTQNPAQFLADSSLFLNTLLGFRVPFYGGNFISPGLGDLNNDGFPELALGYAGGGVLLFANRLGPNAVKDALPGNALKLWPNPAISGSELFTGRPTAAFTLRDYSGKICAEGNTTEKGNLKIPDQLPAGLYLLQLKNLDRTEFIKILIWN